MKKYFLFIFLFLVLILFGCEKEKFEITVHEKDNILIAPTETRTIKASFNVDIELEWTLIKSEYTPFEIEVSPDTRSAKIIGIYDGNATLNISAKGYPKVKKEIKVFVNTNPEIYFNTNKEMSPGQTLNIVVGAKPSFITKDLEFSSGDENIATVSNEGVVTAVLPGIVTIFATSKSTGVSGKTTIYIAGAYKVSIFGKSEVVVGEDNLYTSQIYDRNSNQEVEWSISDSEYGIINKEGLLRTIKSGTFKIYATSVENNKLIGELEITTIEMPSKLSVEYPSRILVGDKINLKYTFDPLLASKDVLITSSNPGVISVNEKGQLLANSWGSTVITVTSIVDSNIYDRKFLKVESSFSSIRGNDSLTIGETKIYTVFESNKRIDDIIWESNDSNIATVSSSGKVTPISYGTFILKAINKFDNKIFRIKEIKVYDLPTQVSYIGATSLPQNRRTELKLDAINSNGNLADPTEFFYTSSDTDVLSIETIENKNYLYAKKDGIVTIDIYSTIVNISLTQEIKVTRYNNNKEYILVTKNIQLNELIKYKDKTYLSGYTAFEDINSALNKAKEGSTIFVVNGNYSNECTISKNKITLIGENATISKPINVNENVKGLTIDGFKFKYNAVINFEKNGGIEDFTFKNNIIYDTVPNIHSNGGFISFPVFNKYNPNKNFEIINNKLFINKDFYTNNRGFINGGNIINISIIGNYIEGMQENYLDAIKLEGDFQNYDGNGIGASGIVRINNNYFNKIGANGISISKYSANSIEIKNNTFDSCGGISAIKMDKWDSSVSTNINIKYNVFKNMKSSSIIRFDNITIGKDSSWRVNINYNKFINFENPSNGESKFIYSLSERAKDLINANDNYFDSPYTDRIVNVGKFNIQFETEEDLDNSILLGK